MQGRGQMAVVGAAVAALGVMRCGTRGRRGSYLCPVRETRCVTEDAGMRNPALRPQPSGARPSVSSEHEMFGTQQAVFSAARNVVRSRKQLARKGRKAPPKSSLFTGRGMRRQGNFHSSGFRKNYDSHADQTRGPPAGPGRQAAQDRPGGTTLLGQLHGRGIRPFPYDVRAYNRRPPLSKRGYLMRSSESLNPTAERWNTPPD